MILGSALPYVQYFSAIHPSRVVGTFLGYCVVALVGNKVAGALLAWLLQYTFSTASRWHTVEEAIGDMCKDMRPLCLRCRDDVQ